MVIESHSSQSQSKKSYTFSLHLPIFWKLSVRSTVKGLTGWNSRCRPGFLSLDTAGLPGWMILNCDGLSFKYIVGCSAASHWLPGAPFICDTQKYLRRCRCPWGRISLVEDHCSNCGACPAAWAVAQGRAVDPRKGRGQTRHRLSTALWLLPACPALPYWGLSGIRGSPGHWAE